MLHIPPDAAKTATVMGIDPGSSNLGVAIIEFDIESMTIVKTIASTLVGVKLMKKDTWDTELHGERFSRIRALKEAMLDLMETHNPVQIACESPFYSQRMPSAFGVLMEVLIAVKEAIYEYDSWRVVWLIDPPRVKQGVGGKGNADKDKMKELVVGLSDLCYEGDVPLAQLDEHSIDAIAVAYCKFKEFTNKA